MNQAKNALSDMAAKVGYGKRAFSEMLKSYTDMQSKTTGEIISNATRFTGQPIDLAAGDWEAEDIGITRVNASYGEDIACVHPILHLHSNMFLLK